MEGKWEGCIKEKKGRKKGSKKMEETQEGKKEKG